MRFPAKLWGDDGSDGVPTICIHGFEDNCSSFDRLIPLLGGASATAARSCYLCVDLPNHGFSSSTPLGARWTMEHYVACVARVADHVRWPMFTLIGHSMGGQIALLYAAVYADHVRRLIMIDTAGPVEVRADETGPYTRRVLDELRRIEHKMAANGASPPSRTWSEALQRISSRIYSRLTEEAKSVLMTR